MTSYNGWIFHNYTQEIFCPNKKNYNNNNSNDNNNNKEKRRKKKE